jgi:hypothetical protein
MLQRLKSCSSGLTLRQKKKTRFRRVFIAFPELCLFDISLCGSYLIGWAAAAEAKKSQPALILPEARDLRHETSHCAKYETKRPR